PQNDFENIYGKSVTQFREDIRPDIRAEILIQRQRGVLEESTDITPKEVKRFYNNLDPDSLGLLPAEVQLNHIVIKSPYSEESKENAKALLGSLATQAREGADFSELAAEYTDEPQGKTRKGDLGWFGRGQMVPEFEEVVFQMRPGEVSDPFPTDFGYHIIFLHERRGETVHASHVLKQLDYDSKGDSLAIDSLKKVMEFVDTDSLTFEQAAILYSQERTSKHCGGCISNPRTQELKIPMDLLDPDMYFKIDEMKAGEISEPSEMQSMDGTRAFHVIYLKQKIPPHTPNLEDDYQKIRNAALLAKRAENFEDWLESAKKNIYIDIKPTECQQALNNWAR
ncbi:MAG: peptidylprolyl isomerase, partial [Bacteroidota bacterium]